MADSHIKGLNPFPGEGLLPAGAETIYYDAVTGKDYRVRRDRITGESTATGPAGTMLGRWFVFTGTLSVPQQVMQGQIYYDATGAYRRVTASGLATELGPDGPVWAQVAVGGGAGGPFTIAGINEFRDRFGESFTGTAEQAFTRLLVKYQVPAFTAFQVGGAGSRTVEVGTAFAAGFKSVTWSTSHPTNVAPNTISLLDVTAGATLATNEPNDGTLAASTAGFAASVGESRRYRLQGTSTEAGTFAADVVITGQYSSYFGYSTAGSLSGAQLVGLGNAQLQQGKARTVAGVTASGGQYTYYAYEASAGDLTSIIQDGAAPVLGAFQKLGDVAATNAQGATVLLRVYRSNAVDAFTSNSLAFS